MGRKKKDPSSRLDRYRLRWNDVVYEPGELKVVAYAADGSVAGECKVATAGRPAKVKLDKRRFGNLLFVEATVVDSAGNCVHSYSGTLEARGKGALKLKAMCNGDATSLEPFAGPRMKAFHGKLVAIFEGVGEKVEILMK
jgi:beta-galactosidase